MKKHMRLLACFLILSAGGHAQQMRGLYVDHFDAILGNAVKEDSLLNYMQDSSFNYMALYDLSSLDYTNAGEMNTLSAFILKARQIYGIPYVGAIGETMSFFTDNIRSYNNSHPNPNAKFNVFNLEFEFWIAASVQPGGYYCEKYLNQAGCDCDTAGAFRYYVSMLHSLDSLAATQGAICETYLGWFNQGQAKQIQPLADRILLHAYRIDNTSVWGYSKTRLSYLASNNQTVNVVPIFSSEEEFMGPWLQDHSLEEASDQYMSDYQTDQDNWTSFINVAGYQWFNYGFMPHNGQSNCFAAVPDGTHTDNITASSAMLHWESVSAADSIVVRYQEESSAEVVYVSMLNSGLASLTLTALNPGTVYSWSVKSVCGNSPGDYSPKNYFSTNGAIGIAEASNEKHTHVMVYPNPATGQVFLAVTLAEEADADVELSELTGKKIYTEHKKLYHGENTFNVDVTAFAKGVYSVTMKTRTENITRKLSIE